MNTVLRVERHNVCRGHPMWKECDKLCFQAKNYYNLANYTMRQEFVANKKVIKYGELNKALKSTDAFKDLGSNSAQMVTQMLCKNWKSFLVAIKDYHKHPKKYLGKPKIPKYLNKDGRYVCILTNMQSQIKDGYLFFAFKRLKSFNNLIKTKITGHHMCTRIKPNGNSYILEIVYEKEIYDAESDVENVASIDLGLNNLITMVNNIGVKPIVINGKKLKSYNQYYNKQISHYSSLAKTVNNKNWTNRLQGFVDKRYWKMEYSLHIISKYIADWCVCYNINTLIVGNNKEWKQNCKINRISRQQFIYIPYINLIQKIKYKCEDYGINVIVVEESYTSGTSFLDNELPTKENYNKSRRKHRGLFISNNGTKINADVNGAYQIMKKVFPNIFDGIEGVHLHPIIINLL